MWLRGVVYGLMDVMVFLIDDLHCVGRRIWSWHWLRTEHLHPQLPLSSSSLHYLTLSSTPSPE